MVRRLAARLRRDGYAIKQLLQDWKQHRPADLASLHPLYVQPATAGTPFMRALTAARSFHTAVPGKSGFTPQNTMVKVQCMAEPLFGTIMKQNKLMYESLVEVDGRRSLNVVTWGAPVPAPVVQAPGDKRRTQGLKKTPSLINKK